MTTFTCFAIRWRLVSTCCSITFLIHWVQKSKSQDSCPYEKKYDRNVVQRRSYFYPSLSLRRELLQMTRLTPSSVLNRLISNYSEGYSFISGWISLNYMPIIITVTTRTGWLCFCGSYDNISVSRSCFFQMTVNFHLSSWSISVLTLWCFCDP